MDLYNKYKVEVICLSIY